MQRKGSSRFAWLVGNLCLCLWVLSYTVGCPEEKKKDECLINSDCTQNDVICKGGQCVALGDIGAACDGDSDCLLNSKQTQRKLNCQSNKCTEVCETNFDCDAATQICDRSNGKCIAKNPDAGETNTEQAPGMKEGEDCSAPTARCEQGLSCIEQAEGKNRKKTCWKTCSANADCASGKVCATGHCVPLGETCSFNSGGTLDDPCWPGLECRREGVVEGACYLPCSGDGDCPSGVPCTELELNKKYCKAKNKQAGADEACGTINGEQVDCIDGYGCIPKSAGSTDSVCTKKCTQASDCQDPSFCNGGYCVLGNVGEAQEGASCKTAAGATKQEICAAGLFCLVFQGKDLGLCYKECRTDPNVCTAPAQCVTLTGANTNLCLKTCTQATDCTAPTGTCAGVVQGGPTYCVHQ
ncbi:MAG: hypothetical protein H6727_17030 [Myxococcales bacterium]|nr:hypothetical protein [Myxococcales bacterium]